MEGKEPENTYDRVFQSFTNRGPNKRKIKPVETQLIQFAFGDSDSEDDEDFEIPNDDHDAESEASDVSHTLEESRNEQESSDSEQASSDENEQIKEAVTVDDLISTAKSSEPDTTSKQFDSLVKETNSNEDNESKSSKQDIMICGICLESESTEEDEVVACDGCGITVHEGCYGDIDDVEDDKSDSDAPTEPWFCDACKAGVEPSCELCPVKGGIFKQTDTGRWAHLVCALYTPGVGFRDIEKLQTIVLEDVPHSKWGLKQCMLCEDDQFSRTGICIDCDAGLCKTFFHVTCAQRNGLLSECPNAGEADENMADPLYAHCKLHTDKRIMKKRIWSYLTFQSNVKDFKPCDDSDEKERIEASLKKAKKEYREFRNKQAPPKIPIDKSPRLLSTCPEACKQLLKKAELLGYATNAHYNTAANKKQSHFHPMLSVEFVNHFYNREKWLKEAETTQGSLQDSINKLESELKILKDSCRDNPQQQKVKAKKETLNIELRNLHSALELIAGKKLALPSVLKPKKAQVQDTSQKLMDKIFLTCATCHKSHDQHLIVECDACHNYYHLGCVDPPLTSVPKKSANYIWQCMECDSSEEEEEEEEEKPAASDDDNSTPKRRPQRASTAPKKFTPSKSPDEKEQDKGKSKRGRKRKNGSRKSEVSSAKKTKVAQNDASSPEVKGGETRGRGRPRSKSTPVKVEEKQEKCSVCKESGSLSKMVKCDECLNNYHFQCLDPPVKKNPKHKGYLWICTNCDEASESEDSSDRSVDINTKKKEDNPEAKSGNE